MAQTNIPVFKKSGRGAQVDLKSIKISEALAWGTYRSNLIRKMNELVPISTIDGHEVYGNIPLLGKTCDTEGDIYELLELLGFSAEDIQEFCDAETDNNFEEFSISWNSTIEISQKTWDAIVDNIQTQLSKYATHINIFHSSKRYPTGTASPQPLYMEQHAVTSGTIDVTLNNQSGVPPAWVADGDGEKIDPTMLQNNVEITIQNGSTDVTADFSDNMIRAIKSFIIMEANVVFPNTNQEYVEVDDGTYITIEHTETFDITLDKTIAKNRYIDYTHPNPLYPGDGTVTEERTIFIGGDGAFLPYYWSYIWQSFTFTPGDLEEASNGLFIMRSFAGFAVNFLTVEGLKKAQPDDLGYWFSQLMKIENKIADETNIFKRFVNGIIKIFTTLAQALVEVFLHIPILKIFMQATIEWVAKKYNLTYDQALKIVESIVLMVVIIVVSYFFPPLLSAAPEVGVGVAATTTLGVSAGTLAAATMIMDVASYAYQAYSLLRQASFMGDENERNRNKMEMQKQSDQMSETKKAFAGTLGTYEDHQNGDNMMYNLMFNPFDTLKQAIEPKQYGYELQ